ncbi:unnamed protein product [Orchesella dallaii]|uniref:VASt domain-containing protein n=1 Tax=Orchesella dallaii TaxID=48710 RepID=A0ABP1QY22_9HEXA
MSDGERMVHASSEATGTHYEGKSPNSDSTISTSPAGNGSNNAISSTSTTGVSASVISHPNSSAFSPTSSTAGASQSTKPGESEQSCSSNSGSKREEAHNTSSDASSVDTFHTPSTSLHSLSVSGGTARINGSNVRKLSDFHSEFLQQRQEDRKLFEEEEEITNEPRAEPVSVQEAATKEELPETPSDIEDIGGEAGVDEHPPEEETIKHTRLQQHKRQSSAGSQCSLSSNPENSQFKTADAHSSDSDVSRNSGTTGGFVFDNCSISPSVLAKEDLDRKSLRSDHSQSGENLNISAESVEVGATSEPLLVRQEEHSPSSSKHYVPSQGPTSSIKPRIKKKMWYQQIFSTSYKTRSGDFKKIFKDLPLKERLIVDYSCALQKEILLQGRMYVSQNYVSFYANIFGWETQTSISFKEIESITKEKTALIIPNAIQISTMTEKFFFSSFVTRDTTYVMLFKLWQSALLEDVSLAGHMSKKELWRLVHTCYGEELGVTSEDESEDVNVMCPPYVATSTVQTLLSDVDGVKSIELDPDVCTGEIGPAIAVGLNIGSSIITSNGIPITSDQLLMKDANLVPLPVPLPMTVDPSDSSDTEAVLESEFRKELSPISVIVPVPSHISEGIDSGSESVVSTVPPVCPVDHSNGKETLNTVIPCNIDQLFTMLFTNSKFYLDFQLSRKTCDINQSDWQLGDRSQKTRQLTFTVQTGQMVGPKQAQVTETQTLVPESRPGLLYAIQSESVNAGIPYADAFSVNCHYCLSKVSTTESKLVVISKINYKKTIWGVKSFIEKNSMAALNDFFSHLERALKEECAKMTLGGITPITSPIVSNLPRRRHPRKKCRAPDIPASALTRPIVETSIIHPGTFIYGVRHAAANATAAEVLSETTGDNVESSKTMKVILTVLGCLLLLNAFLYYKLSYLETSANTSLMFPPRLQFTGAIPQTHQEWLVLLQQQDTLHKSEVHSWHEILGSAIGILHQAEKDLENLKKHISTYGHTSHVVKVAPPIERESLDASSENVKKSEDTPISPSEGIRKEQAHRDNNNKVNSVVSHNE